MSEIKPINVKKGFSASALLFWIKGSISIDYRFIRVIEKNTFLGLIPSGTFKQNIPLKNVTDIELNTNYKIGRFILGIVLILLGISIMSNSAFMGLIILIIGMGTFLNGIMTQLAIEKGGSTFTINVPFFNKSDMIDAQQAIEEALATDADKTDLNLYSHQNNNNGQIQ
ncbi:hypothetical protein [Lentilactobacillus parakefiri]|uniref:Uncharacterized protein n=1 Tax=Lentilactobacillus parakefiri TaxID=152332 RepID=A0A224V8Q2_9LACO|nr:hypothetical protein [Lentilactobacillus parakefiri]KRL75652.1 hypothetical protein FD08_GL000003 [Lentilactobacillus parakefiri DSM 10551]TDG89867.1 hypothetical protein C5L28_002222 [Lentilactobacillus parakefiri]GAW71145.1 hypothetical protein LPKJCM_00216 [Lentilactobacillus parakefiri]